MTMSSAETWAKALTAMEAGVVIEWSDSPGPAGWYAFVGDRSRDVLLDGFNPIGDETADYVAACDALSLPWQQHRVWKMKQALEVWLPIVWGAKYDEMNHEYNLRVAAETWRKLHWAFLDAAKGGG